MSLRRGGSVTNTGVLRVKTFRFIGPSSGGGSVVLSHGLDISKIISWAAFVANTTSSKVAHAQLSPIGVEFSVHVTGSQLAIILDGTNAVTIFNKEFEALIWYVD